MFLVSKIQLDCVLSLSSYLSVDVCKGRSLKTILLRAHCGWAFGTRYLGLSVITPALPLAPSQKNVSRKLPRVHARKYIAIKLLRNTPITLTMTPHLIETAQSGVREGEMGTKEGDENSKPPSPK